MSSLGNLFKTWCSWTVESIGEHSLTVLSERLGGRNAVASDLHTVLRSHYDTPKSIATDIEELGYEGAAALLREQMPEDATARSGDLGEVLAAEYVDRNTDYRVPVRRLRFKDGRDLALRGDDIIGVQLTDDGNLGYLKGEVKSEIRMGSRTVRKARAALKKHGNGPGKPSLLFIAKRLFESGEADAQALGRQIRNAVARNSVPDTRIEHMIFALSGHSAASFLRADLTEYDGAIVQKSVNLIIRGHAEFVALLYEGALTLGDT